MHQFQPLYALNEKAYALYCRETDYVQVHFNMIALVLSKEDFIDVVQDPVSVPLFHPIKNKKQLFELLEGADTALLEIEMVNFCETEL